MRYDPKASQVQWDMGWQDQGRQGHGWFGDGTSMDAPRDKRDGSDAAPATSGGRIDAIAHSVIAHVGSDDRTHAALLFDARSLKKLRDTMQSWNSAGALSRDAFRQRFLDLRADDATVDLLRSAAKGAAEAKTNADLVAPGAALTKAMQRIGLDRWTATLNDAADRANAQQSPPETPGGPTVVESQDIQQPDRVGETRRSYHTAVAKLDMNAVDKSGVNFECVAAVRKLTGAPQAKTWLPGSLVRGNHDIPPGTAIATFDKDGHYRGHAAIYLGQDAGSLRVYDQWTARYAKDGSKIRPNQVPHTHPIRFLGGHADPSKDGDQFYVVETR